MTTTNNTQAIRIWHLGDLAWVAGSETTEAEAEALRDVLVDRDLLVWTSDRDGGVLICTDDEFTQALKDSGA